MANLYRGSIGDARLCFTRSLLICRQMGLSETGAAGTAGCAPAIDGLAAVALRQGEGDANYVRAARLLGISAAFRLRQGGGYRVEMVERPLYERTVHEAQTNLSSEAFSKAWQEGRDLPLARAVPYALGDPVGQL